VNYSVCEYESEINGTYNFCKQIQVVQKVNPYRIIEKKCTAILESNSSTKTLKYYELVLNFLFVTLSVTMLSAAIGENKCKW